MPKQESLSEGRSAAARRQRVSIAFLVILFSILSTCRPYDLDRRSNTSSTADAPPGRIPFPIGVFEDANILDGDEISFRAMIAELQSRGLDAVLFSNNFAERDAALLKVSDELGFSVYMLPSGDLNETWWPAEIPADGAAAIKAARQIVGYWKPHPSLKGYITKDEPGLGDLDKVRLIQQAFRDLDSTRPAMPILIGLDRVRPIFAAAQPDVMLIDVYPAGAENPICDFTLTGFGYKTHDFVRYIRSVTRNKPPSTPLWVILQTHSFLDQLREPAQSEVRMQHWLAIGEGSKGLFWFVYSSQQGWRGLRDNPTLFAEVASLARRTAPLRSVLQGLQKVEDQFSVTGPGDQGHYASTFRSGDSRTYVVAVNQDCRNVQNLRIRSFALDGQLVDLETSEVYRLDSPIPFPPGDGKIFELVVQNAAAEVFLRRFGR